MGDVDDEVVRRMLADPAFAAALDALFDHVTVARAVRGSDGELIDFEIAFVNAAFEDGAGRRGDELVGHRVLGLYPGWMASGLWDRFSAVVETGVPFVDHRIPYADETIDGVVIDGHWTLSALRFGDGYLAVSRDVTALVREEHERQEALRALERSRMAVDLLQRVALPAALPSLPGVAVAARHAPAAGDQALGGDWYDAFTLADGKLALVIADVAGHGPEAAAHMVQLRTLVRTLAVEHVSPEVVLRRAGAAVARATDRELHATCGFAVLDVGTRTLRWASAGHLPLLRVGAEAAFLEAPTGLPLGVDPDGEVQAREVVLDPGDRVVAFTDGLVETRGEELGASLERVRAQLDRWGPLGIEATVAALVEARNDDSDDLAVLGIELCGAQTP